MKHPRRSVLASLVLLSLLLQPSSAAQSPGPPDSLHKASTQLAGSILVGGHSMDYLRNLADAFGGRLSGSPAHQRAAEWAAALFRAVGISNVRLEPFTVPNGWERGPALGRIVEPFERPIHIESLGWSPSTPPGGVKGEVVKLGDVGGDRFKTKLSSIKGEIVMLDLGSIFAEGTEGSPSWWPRFLS